ncbi:hypothetical protein BC940DRAFT_358013 [Gongronella butleri]|nr:hypothetical protein BC940DRAFT_358013 [Gongronella butleri]
MPFWFALIFDLISWILSALISPIVVPLVEFLIRHLVSLAAFAWLMLFDELVKPIATFIGKKVLSILKEFRMSYHVMTPDELVAAGDPDWVIAALRARTGARLVREQLAREAAEKAAMEKSAAKKAIAGQAAAENAAAKKIMAGKPAAQPQLETTRPKRVDVGIKEPPAPKDATKRRAAPRVAPITPPSPTLNDPVKIELVTETPFSPISPIFPPPSMALTPLFELPFVATEARPPAQLESLECMSWGGLRFSKHAPWGPVALLAHEPMPEPAIAPIFDTDVDMESSDGPIAIEWTPAFDAEMQMTPIVSEDREMDTPTTNVDDAEMPLARIDAKDMEMGTPSANDDTVATECSSVGDAEMQLAPIVAKDMDMDMFSSKEDQLVEKDTCAAKNDAPAIMLMDEDAKKVPVLKTNLPIQAKMTPTTLESASSIPAAVQPTTTKTPSKPDSLVNKPKLAPLFKLASPISPVSSTSDASEPDSPDSLDAPKTPSPTSSKTVAPGSSKSASAKSSTGFTPVLPKSAALKAPAASKSDSLGPLDAPKVSSKPIAPTPLKPSFDFTPVSFKLAMSGAKPDSRDSQWTPPPASSTPVSPASPHPSRWAFFKPVTVKLALPKSLTALKPDACDAPKTPALSSPKQVSPNASKKASPKHDSSAASKSAPQKALCAASPVSPDASKKPAPKKPSSAVPEKLALPPRTAAKSGVAQPAVLPAERKILTPRTKCVPKPSPPPALKVDKDGFKVPALPTKAKTPTASTSSANSKKPTPHAANWPAPAVMPRPSIPSPSTPPARRQT